MLRGGFIDLRLAAISCVLLTLTNVFMNAHLTKSVKVSTVLNSKNHVLAILRPFSALIDNLFKLYGRVSKRAQGLV